MGSGANKGLLGCGNGLSLVFWKKLWVLVAWVSGAYVNARFFFFLIAEERPARRVL